MRRLAVLIRASGTLEAQEALDDVVASVAAGQGKSRHEADGTRVQFAWYGRENAEVEVTEAVAELLREAWECGLVIDQVADAAFSLALEKIRGQAA
jgi:hypothetical protein